MKNITRTIVVAVWLGYLLGIAGAQAAAVNFTGTYAQNFDSLGVSGTAQAAGFRTMVTGSGNTVYTAAIPISAAGIAAATASGTQTLTVWNAGSAVASSATTLFNVGSWGNTTDRALGSDATTVAAMVVELSLINQVGSNLLGVTFSYDLKGMTNGTISSQPTGNEATELPGYAFFFSTTGGTTAADWARVDALCLTNSAQGTTSSSGTVTITFPTPLANGGTMYFRWADDNNVAASPDQMIAIDNITIGISTNTAPAVTLNTPANGTAVGLGTNITLTATAADANGTVTKVEFFAGATKLAMVASAPYEFTWTGAALGSYSVTAKATDNDGASTVSSAINVNVVPDTGTGALYFDGVNDYVTFGAAPALGVSNFTAEVWFKRTGAGVATSTGSGGVTTAVPLVTKGRGEADGSNLDCNFFLGINTANGALAADFEDLNTGLNHPVLGVTPVTSDVWNHAAVTYDVASGTWVLYLNGVPEVTNVISGAAAVRMPRFDSIQHAALGSALTSAGTAAGFFMGRLDEARLWNYARSGAEIVASFQLQITNATGLIGRWSLDLTSGTVAVNDGTSGVNGTLLNGPLIVGGYPFGTIINSAPTASITSPAANANFGEGDNVTIQVTSVDIDGSVTNVDFLVDGVKIGQDTDAPFSFVWPNATFGAHTLTAVASDNNGATKTSVAVSINVNPTAGVGGLYFDGVNDYVTFGPAGGLGVSNFTAECWIKRLGTGQTTGTGTGGLTATPILTKGRSESDGSNVDCNFFLGVNVNGTLGADFEDYNSGLNHPITGIGVVANNVWTHVAVTYDVAAGTWVLYLNGVPDATNVISGTDAVRTPRFDSIQHGGLGTALNSSGAAAGFFQGVIDEARVWSYARSAAQIAASYNQQIASAPGLLARWSLDEGTGVTANSDGSSGVAGTLNGGPSWVAGYPFNNPPPVNNAPTAPVVISPTNTVTGAVNPTVLSVQVSDPDGDPLTVTFYGRPKPGAAGADFTLVALPDTQFYSETYSNVFFSQTDWLLNNRSLLNIPYVAQLGDCVQNGDNGGNDREWRIATNALYRLENPLTTTLPFGIPYGVAVGNHDQGPTGNGVATDTTLFYNQYFGTNHFQPYGYYGGNYSTNNDNHYDLFSASGMEFIVIYFEYDTTLTSTSAPIFTWANNLLQTYSNRRAIVVSHWIINSGTGGSFSAQGQTMYNALKGNTNLFLMLCGHVNPNGEGRRSDVYNGNTVWTLLSDYQDLANGGNGWLRTYQFSPSNNVIRAKTYSPWLDQSQTGTSSQFEIPYQMNGSPWVALGTKTGVPSGSTTSFPWAGLSTSAEYEWYAVVSDGSKSATNAVVLFSTDTSFPPAPPVVTLTSPASGASFAAPALISLAATAQDFDGTVAKVEFYAGAVKVGEDTTSPYNFDWTGVSAGSYQLIVVATDNSGLMATSGPVTINVSNPPPTTVTRGPYLQLSTPTNIVIRWRTELAASSRVLFGTNPAGLDQSITNLGAVINHEITLTNLQPDTRYFYAIGTATALQCGPDANLYFLTHPQPGAPKPLRVWVIGDAGTGSGSQTSVRDAFYNWNGTNLVHAWLQLGDNAYNSGLDSEFQANMFNIYTNMLRHTVTWPTLGNHETAQATAFVDTYAHFDIFTLPTAGQAGGVPSGTEHYYSFDIGMVHFICLDSMTADRSPTGAMATWLQSDLAATTSPWIIAYFHHPPYTKGSHNSDTETELIQMRQNFLPILEAGGVDLVLSGHSHCYERSYLIDGHYGLSSTFNDSFKKDGGSGREDGPGAYKKPLNGSDAHTGSIYAVVGSSGQASGGSLNHPAMYLSLNNLGSMVLDVSSNRLDAKFLRENGNTNDYFTILKTVPAVTLAITNPAPGANYTAPATFAVEASATVTNGTITQVEFFADAISLGVDNSAPYSATATAIAAGSHTLSVVATDNQGGKTTNSISITVTPPFLSPGAIAFTGWNVDGNDDLAFVALVQIPGNSIIYFTDNEWNGQAIGAGGAFNDFAESEWVWTAPPSGLAAGTVVTINSVGASPATTMGAVQFVDSTNPGLSNGADAIYAFQGATHSPAVFLAQISSDTAASIANTGLTNGITAVTLSSSSDGARYKGARSGQPAYAGYLALIGNVAANWDDIGNGDGTSYLPFNTNAFTLLSDQLAVTEIQSSQAAASVNDYWELSNLGGTPVDLSNWKWNDIARVPTGAAAVMIPAGTTIAAGESIIFTALTPAAFRTWWGISSSVQVISTGAAPGLGQNDAVSLFNDTGAEVLFLNYSAGGFTRSNGTLALGGHAGASAGGSATAALVLDPTFGTSAASRRYTAAAVGALGAFASAANAADIGSPGVTAAPPASAPSVTTSAATGIGTVVATLNGNVISDGGSAITERGFVYKTSSGVAITDNKTAVSGTTGGFTLSPTLGANVQYLFRAYAINSLGTTLSPSELNFWTLALTPSAPTVGSPTASNLTVIVNANGNPTGTTFAIHETTQNKYLQADGTLNTTTVYQTAAVWGAVTVQALSPGTAYTFEVKARNGGGTDTAFGPATGGSTAPAGLGSVNLANYVRIGRYNLPEPTRTTPPDSRNLLAQEASGVAYNWDTDTLFVVGDGGTAVVQVSKAGQLIDSMTLAAGSSPQGGDFYDPEGITYIGNGQFVFCEERDRQLVLFTYAAGTTLTRSAAKTVKLGTFVQNIGIEGLSYDPQTGGFICVKETQPQGVFQTVVDFVAGTASNGSPTTENSTNLFDPARLNLLDLADVFALSNLPGLAGQPDGSHLLLLSQESGKIVNADRSGTVYSSLTIVSDPGNPLSVPAQQHEGLTMDRAGNLYLVSENGGGDFDHPQLWVYAPSTVPNQAPTAVILTNVISSIAENTATTSPIKVADILVADDALGNNNLTLSGADASFFAINGTGLYLQAGTVLDFETKSSYNVTINVDDPTIGSTPDVITNYSLTVTDVVNEAPPVVTLIISEVAAWSSGNSPIVAADWFEVSNLGSSPVDITGWKVDDSSAAFATALPLTGITSIAPGESVIFIETADLPGKSAAFRSNWFGANPPAGLQIGSYTGSGIGLSTAGDGVFLYNSNGVLQASVSFGASPASAPFATFNNAVGLNGTNISQLSAVGVNGALVAVNDANEIGSPGTVGKLFISEVAPWSSGNSAIVAADWFEVMNTTARPVDITGWKVDDNSGSPVAAVPLSGITSIAPGEAVIFIELPTVGDLAAKSAAFRSNWFGANPPAGLHIGGYSGGGVGLGTGGDAVNLYNSNGVLQASVAFGTSPVSAPFATFDNAAGLNNITTMPLTMAGINGAFAAANDANEIGTPGNAVTFLGVASGDADASSAVLWTRINPPQVNTPQIVSLKAQVSTDVNFGGNPLAFSCANDPAKDYTVKVGATNLTAGTRYYYRFVVDGTGEVSRTGAFKTAPATNAAVAVKFAFSGDMDGLMRPYALASTLPGQQLDFYVNLGDVIYENASAAVGNNGAAWLNSPSVTLSGSSATLNGEPVGGTNFATRQQLFDDYNKKYRENFLPVNTNGQSSLKDFYAGQGNYTLYDNHELGNRQYINGGAPAGGSVGGTNGTDMPTGRGVDARANGTSNMGNTNDTNTSASDYMNRAQGFLTLQQVFLNYQPVRENRTAGGVINAPTDPRTHGTKQLYFAQPWGRNALYITVDDRTYRDLRLKSANGAADDTGARAANPNRTMLGATQLAWLKQTLLAAQAAGTPWKFIAISDPIDQLGPIGGALSGTLTAVNSDGGKSWMGGYRAERNDLLKFIADNHIQNVVFMATDDHQNRINELLYSPTGQTENQASYVKVPYCFSIVCGPLGATGPETITDHRFNNIKAIADSLATAQGNAGVEPVGLTGYPGLHNLVREGDANASANPQAVDFYSPDTFNYTLLSVSADGRTLTVASQGINATAQNSASEYNDTINAARQIFGFQIEVNQSPTVNLVGPVNGAVLASPAGFVIEANASDSDGSVAQVEFFIDGVSVGATVVSPYRSTNTISLAGSHTLTAIATDNAGAMATNSVTILLNTPPQVSVTNLVSGALFQAPASIDIKAAASDADGTVTQVQFFANGQLLATSASPPYNFTWSSVPQGFYYVTAVATDNRGATSTSASHEIIVGPSGLVTPQVQTNGTFQFTLVTTPGKTIVIETSTDLINWTPISTNVVTTGLANVIDSGLTNSGRYYRARELPAP